MNNSLNFLTSLTCIKGKIAGFAAFTGENDTKSLTIGIQTAEGQAVMVYFDQGSQEIKQYARVDDEVIIHANAISPKFCQGIIFEFATYKLKDQKGKLNEQIAECRRKVTLMQSLFMKFAVYFKQQGNNEAATYYLTRRLGLGRELPVLGVIA